MQVLDDPELLDRMLADQSGAAALWRPTPYWEGYCLRVAQELRRSGLQDFRVNQRILKGFGVGGIPQPNLPVRALKRAIWLGLERTPGFAKIVGEYRRLVRSAHGNVVAHHISHARMRLREIAEEYPDLAVPAGLGHGGAEDVFVWKGQEVSAAWVLYLDRVAKLYRTIDRAEISSIVEIGGGLGYNVLAHLALNPGLSSVLYVDIAPILYVSTQFLKSIPGLQIVDSRAIGRARPPIEAGKGRPIVYMAAPWQLPQFDPLFDLFTNMASFQEMEPEVCANYAKHVSGLVGKYVVLLNRLDGTAPAGTQKEAVTLSFLSGLFREKFPGHRVIEQGDDPIYGSSEPNYIVLSAPR